MDDGLSAANAESEWIDPAALRRQHASCWHIPPAPLLSPPLGQEKLTAAKKRRETVLMSLANSLHSLPFSCLSASIPIPDENISLTPPPPLNPPSSQ